MYNKHTNQGERMSEMTTSMFDDFVLKAKDIADAAGKKTTELYEISKYKYECIKINGEIKRLYEQLGSSVYSMVKNGYDNNDLIDSLTEEIDEHLQRLKEINNIIADKKNQIACPVCGAKNNIDSSYCSKCGSRLRSDDNSEEDSSSEAPAVFVNEKDSTEADGEE